ncbi:MAG TPA: hypothetical protein V6D47_13865 [Oscillatoriaceae cyanobacterium]
MTWWVPRPSQLCAVALAIAAVGAASPASAIPIVDVGAHARAAVQWTGAGPAGDLSAGVDLRGLELSAFYWKPFTTQGNWVDAQVGWDLSPVPMISVTPSVGVAALNGGFGPIGSVRGSFTPLLLPVSVEAMAGVSPLTGGLMYPYSLGLKLSLIPFTSLDLAYRGWAGAVNMMSGPELGVEIGL